jgi:hypothetical protein
MIAPKQLQLALPKRGGKRPGAGRPRTRPHPGLTGPGVPHVKRQDFAGRNPLHITQRMQPGVGELRTQVRLRLLKRAFHAASGWSGMQAVLRASAARRSSSSRSSRDTPGGVFATSQALILWRFHVWYHHAASRESIARASSTVAGSRPMSRAIRTAFATRSPLLFAICLPALSR